MKKYEAKCARFFLALALVLILPFSEVYSSLHIVDSSHQADGAQSLTFQKISQQPVIFHPDAIDTDFDKIQDSLESKILTDIVNGSEVLPVTVTLNSPVANQDMVWFTMLEGKVTKVYHYVTYGFAGTIPSINIEKFASLEKENLSIIEYDAPLDYHLDVSVPLVKARPLIWNTYGYTGSPQHSIAIIDTGIDDSHPDLGPFGDLNFSRKMVGWHDATSDNSLVPEDYGEHGTHVAGIAAGTGVTNPLQGFGSLRTTFTLALPQVNYGYADYIDVLSPGKINLSVTWGGANTVRVRLDNPAGTTVKYTTGSSQPLTLTYDTTGSSYPTGRYRVIVFNLGGPSGTPFSCAETYPYQGLNDGYNLFTGMAPDSRLVGVKVFDNAGSGAVSTLIGGLDWIIQNRIAYHIVVASMSLGLQNGGINTTLDQKVDTMVLNGIITTVSAGNGYPSYTIGSPGTAAYALTVAATNDQNGLTDYSSNGDILKNEYGLIKPDVAAPGGTFNVQYGNQIMSTDSNDADHRYSGYADQNLNDYQQMAGTSMAAPHVAGLAALTAQAIGNWNWTLEDALRVKMLIGMTAFEVQSGEGTNLPPLNRGDKDSREGYGRISADAAVEAATMGYNVGESATDTLGSAPSGKKVWARRVFLSANITYEFNLSVPSSADYDLYLYGGTPDDYGQPIILQKSINASTGVKESFQYIPTYTGMRYIVAKWVNGNGVFNLTSAVKLHDVAVTSIIPSASQVYAGNPLNIAVVVRNKGAFSETFNVTAYYSSNPIGTQNVINLASNSTQMLFFTWNTSNVLPGNYIMAATATPILYEAELSDNSLTGGEVRIKIPGDFNGDAIINVSDLSALSAHWYPGPPMGLLGYDSNADMNRDGAINVEDITIISAHWTGPPKGPLGP